MNDSVNSFLTYHLRLQPQAWVYKLFQQAAIGKSLCFDWQCKSSDIGQIKFLLSCRHSTKHNTSTIFLLHSLPFLIFTLPSYVLNMSLRMLRSVPIYEALCLTGCCQWFPCSCSWSTILTRASRIWSFFPRPTNHKFISSFQHQVHLESLFVVSLSGYFFLQYFIHRSWDQILGSGREGTFHAFWLSGKKMRTNVFTVTFRKNITCFGKFEENWWRTCMS